MKVRIQYLIRAGTQIIIQILQGSLRETLYDWPDESTKKNGPPAPLHAKKETIYEENEVTYMSDKVSANRPSISS